MLRTSPNIKSTTTSKADKFMPARSINSSHHIPLQPVGRSSADKKPYSLTQNFTNKAQIPNQKSANSIERQKNMMERLAANTRSTGKQLIDENKSK